MNAFHYFDFFSRFLAMQNVSTGMTLLVQPKRTQITVMKEALEMDLDSKVFTAFMASILSLVEQETRISRF